MAKREHMLHISTEPMKHCAGWTAEWMAMRTQGNKGTLEQLHLAQKLTADIVETSSFMPDATNRQILLKGKQMTLTPFQIKILTAIRDNPEIRAKALAVKLWPDSPAHTKLSNGGHGAAKGKAAWLAAGSQAAKIERKKWIKSSWEGGYTITLEGKRLLEEQVNE